MDWLKAHINEVILPNLQGDLQELTGITLDDSLGEFKVVAEPLDEDVEDCEEFEITIVLGDLCLVDACFLLEEVESGVLPFCTPDDELTKELVAAKLKVLREQVVPLLREEFVQELAENQWNPKLAHLLNITPEVVESVSAMRSSGGYPPMVLVFRHPDYDPDAFEVTSRIDPMASEEWVDWKPLMEAMNTALKAIGEEPFETAPAPDPDGGPGEPSAEDLEDTEIAEIENDLEDGDSEGGGGGGGAGDTSAALTGNLLASLEATLGIKLTKGGARGGKDDDDEPAGKPAKKPAKKKAKAPAKKKAKKSSAKKKTAGKR